MKTKRAWVWVTMLVSASVSAATEIKPDKIHLADVKKNNQYVRDGMITGGDRAIKDVLVQEIRWGANAGFERVVIQLRGNVNGEPAAVPRSPYFQVAVNKDEHRLIVSIWGSPKFGFDSKKVVQAFRRSKIVQNVVLLPRLEEDSWTFALELNGEPAVEMMEMSSPVRLVLDLQKKTH